MNLKSDIDKLLSYIERVSYDPNSNKVSLFIFEDKLILVHCYFEGEEPEETIVVDTEPDEDRIDAATVARLLFARMTDGEKFMWLYDRIISIHQELKADINRIDTKINEDYKEIRLKLRGIKARIASNESQITSNKNTIIKNKVYIDNIRDDIASIHQDINTLMISSHPAGSCG